MPSAGSSASSSSSAYSGSHALALSGSYNLAALSAPLSTLGTLDSSAHVEVAAPAALQGQTWLGQIALVFNANSEGVFNAYGGPTVLSGPVGIYRGYSIPIPSSVVSALAGKSYQDLTVTVVLNVPATSGAFLIDELRLTPSPNDAGADPDASQSSGNGGSTGTLGGSGGAAGGGIAGGNGAAAGGFGGASTSDSGSGAAGAKGGGASGGSGSVSNPPGPGTIVTFFFDLPNGVRPSDVVLGTTGGDLLIDDGVKLLEGSGFASVSSVALGKVARVGVGAEANRVWSDGDVTLANYAHVHGSLMTSGSLHTQAGAVVDGAVSEHASLDPLGVVSWQVVFPSQTNGPVNLEPDQIRAILPGAYDGATVKSRAHLKLSAGVYTFDSGLDLEPGAVLEVDNSGPVLIYMRGAFTFRGILQKSQDRSNVLFATAATGSVPIESALSGAIVVAPWAKVFLGTTAGHAVSVFANSIEANANTNIVHQPFDGGNFCVHGVDAPGCPSHCGNGVKDGTETDVDCGGECPACKPKGECTSDMDCEAGLICGHNNGGCFGFARSKRVCWKPDCETDVNAGGCGQADSACGSNCACVVGCNASNPANQCPDGEHCAPKMGSIFNTTGDACIPDDGSCPSNDPDLCGFNRALCGQNCICKPDCSHATCEDPDDGCGGFCPGVCKDGEEHPPGKGCKDDVSCQPGSACVQNPDGSRTCVPVHECLLRVPTPPLCGTPGAKCGPTCPVCTPQCDGRTCGLDPNCGQSCGTCGAGSFCSGDGQCITPKPPTPILVPDGTGHDVPLEDLPKPQTSPVGALKGSFSVSEQGTAQYTIPIEVPPGRAGMQPSLSLQYAATRANEDVGVGWHVEGLSQISRCPRIFALDKAGGPVKNTPDDLFCLDGKRLERVKGVTTGTVGQYGANGTEYRTMIDTFARIISYRDGEGGVQLEPWPSIPIVKRELHGPDYFRVYTKDGRILTFGKTREALVISRSGVRYSWLLSRVEDHFGNTIDYHYKNLAVTVPEALADRLSNIVRPDFITYTGHLATGGEGNRKVQFTYEDRTDPQIRFRQGGIAYLTQERLSRITTYVNDAPVKNYRLKYDDTLSFSQIKQISECTGDADTLCKPPTQFKYEVESGFEGFNGPPIDNFAQAMQFDLNGDGVPDFLKSRTDVTEPQMSDEGSALEIFADIGVTILSVAAPGVGTAASFLWTMGRSDFESGFMIGGASSTFETMALSQPNGSWSMLEKGAFHGVPCSTTNLFVMDFDHDGKDDLVGACGLRGGEIHVGRSLGNGSFAAYHDPNGTPGINGSFIYVPIGYVHPTADTRVVFQDPVPPLMFDVDGDGLQDLVTCKDQYTLEVRLRLGAKEGFANKPISLPPSPTGTPPPTLPFCGRGGHPIHAIIDIDGDGSPAPVPRAVLGGLESLALHRA